MSRPRPSTPSSTFKSVTPGTPQRNLSSFAPWDRLQLVSRLATYKSILWSRLPEEINEFVWARRGWIERHDGLIGVKCELCGCSVEVFSDPIRIPAKVQTEEKANVN